MAEVANPYLLTLRGTYILPSGAGLLQGLGWSLLVAASLNFDLGVMLMMTLLLGALALVSMVETVRNLSGLEVHLAPGAPVASATESGFAVHLRPLDGRPRPGVLVGLAGAADGPRWKTLLGLQRDLLVLPCEVPGEGLLLTLPLAAASRGRLRPHHVLVATTWPFGLFRAWRTWQPEVAAAIHPAPLATLGAHAAGSDGAVPITVPDRIAAGRATQEADAEFAGHRQYRSSDPRRRIDWRASLRAGRVLVVEREAVSDATPVWLRWSDHAPADGELRLARLAGQVIEADRSGRPYGLELPDARLELGSGVQQRDLALALLADFPAEHGVPGEPPRAELQPIAREPVSRATMTLPDKTLLHWTICLVLAALPLAIQLAPGAYLPWVALVLTRLLLIHRRSPSPGTGPLSALALAAAAWIYATHHTLIGREPGMALLLVMAGLKLLEVRRERDLHMLTVLSLFLLLSAHFRTQSPLLAAWDLGVIGLLLLGLLRAHQSSERPPPRATLVRLLLFALPLGALLFLLLPRPESALWGVGNQDQADSGSLSDRMTPGSISHLRLSDRVAFRVQFLSAWPASPRMYWRGPVLDHFDGQTWSTLSFTPPRLVSASTGTKPIDYRYEAEPSEGEWVFALELAEVGDRDLRMDFEGVVRTRGGATEARAWKLRSWPDAHLEVDGNAEDLAYDLALPEGNPLTRSLAEPWRQLPVAERLNAARAAFLNAHLHYSLDVPPLGADPIDDLMFRSRTGYCEHFASAFAFMLRAAGVPARVVTGYQGGERNPLGDYLIVRQSDAHAWVEAWQEGQGWSRIDPTALTVPARLAGGSQAAAPLPLPAWMPGFVRAGWPLWHRLQLARDLAVMRWQQDIANLNARQQRALLASIGLDHLPKAQLAAACALLISLAIGVQLLSSVRPVAADRLMPPMAAAGEADPHARLVRRRRREWQRYWKLGEAALRLGGWTRGRMEGPRAFVERLSLSQPGLARSLDRWAFPCLIACYASDDQVLALGSAWRAEGPTLALLLAVLRERLMLRGNPQARAARTTAAHRH